MTASINYIADVRCVDGEIPPSQLRGQAPPDEQSINYVVENADLAKTKAVEDAMRRARSNAETAARVGGRELGKLVTAKIDITETPILVTRGQMFESLEVQSPTSTRKEMLPPPPPPPPPAEFGAGKITVVAHVTALFGLK